MKASFNSQHNLKSPGNGASMKDHLDLVVCDMAVVVILINGKTCPWWVDHSLCFQRVEGVN